MSPSPLYLHLPATSNKPLHLSRDTQRIVECIRGILARQAISGSLSIITSIHSVLGSIAAASKLRADEARDNVDVVGRTVVEVVLVDSGKRIGIATVSLGRELDGRVGAITKVESGALLGGRGGVAVVLCRRLLV